MSRTDKDRPYWVVMNDRTLGRVEDHYHIFYGEKTYSRLVYRGDKIEYEPYGEPVWILRHKDGVPGLTREEDAKQHRAPLWGYPPLRARSLRWYFECRVREVRDNVYREITVPANYCSIDEPYAKDVYLNCDVRPYYVNTPGRSWYSRPKDKQDRVRNERRRRRVASQKVSQYASEYNLHGDVDDSLWAEYAPRHTPFKGGAWNW